MYISYLRRKIFFSPYNVHRFFIYYSITAFSIRKLNITLKMSSYLLTLINHFYSFVHFMELYKIILRI